MKHLTAFRCQVVKLFAKHLKIEEQKVMLRKGCFPLGVSARACVEGTGGVIMFVLLQNMT